ncbi:MAG: hypothetical protein WKF84_12305 [Pyrinomonadaceae bacterium]
MNSLLSGLRSFLGNRRRCARCQASLPVSVSVASSIASNTRWPAPLIGHTRDLSATHVALIVPSIRIGSRYLTARDSRILVDLNLMDEKIEIEGTPVRYDKIENDADKGGHLIVAKIRRISDTGRALYAEYIRSLG